jgi:hypothetical protein
MRISKIALAVAVAGVMTAGAAHAATQSVTANIAFDTPLTLTPVASIQFGTVKAAQTGTYVINTAGAVTASSGGVWLYGTPAAGNLTVAGSATQTITISTGSYVASNGVTPSAATCKYGSASAAACDSGLSVAAPGASTTLLLGVQADADGTQAAASTATPSFTVTAVYN